MCGDLKTMSMKDLRLRLRRAFTDYSTTDPDSSAERFALNILRLVVEEMCRRNETPSKGKLYLSGPMRGYPEFNFPAFHAKSQELRAEGWEVFSPAEADIRVWGEDKSKDHPEGKETNEPGMSAAECMARDCKFICEEATAMYMLKGWEKSTGAQAEWALARAIHLPVMYEGEMK